MQAGSVLQPVRKHRLLSDGVSMPLLIIAIVILGMGALTMTTTSSVRGIRINNPLNIRIAGNPWKGKVTPSRDNAFETFKAPEWGFRAGAILLRNY